MARSAAAALLTAAPLGAPAAGAQEVSEVEDLDVNLPNTLDDASAARPGSAELQGRTAV